MSSSRSDLPVVSQSIGIPVEEYLARADTTTLLSSPTLTKSSLSGSDKKVLVGTAPESVQIGEPSGYVAILYRLCQTTQGLVPLFDIECDGQGVWGGTLVVGDRTISRGEMRWQTKKAAREALAKVGVGAVRGMMKSEDGEAKNWVGMLQDYHAASVSGPIYNELTLLGSGFACTCTIPARPSTPFGSLSTPLLSKKAARTNAAREAMQFLISRDLAVPLNNTTSANDIDPKTETGGAEMYRMLSTEGDDLADVSFTLKVLRLCSLLRLPQPTYQFPPNPLAPGSNILTGAAYFVESANHPLLVGPVGEVRNVFGKKNAKEECARRVFQVLMKIITSGEKDLVGG